MTALTSLTVWCVLAAAVVSSSIAQTGGSGTWPAHTNQSCHSATAGGRIIDISGVTHAQCAAACDAHHCGCFDMDDQGSCRATRDFWGFRASHDRNAYSTGVTPPPAPPHKRHPPPPPLAPAVQKLMLKYSAIRNETCATAAQAAPVLPQPLSSAFLDAYRAFNGTTDEGPVLQSARAVLALPTVEAFFSLPDSFSTPDGLDAMLVKCAVISAATPIGLAEFAANGTAAEALVDRLLSDSMLMRDMLVAGGAREGQYGNAMQIFSKINQASDALPLTKVSVPPPGMWDDRSPETILHRLALGTALGHAAPIQTSYTELNASDAYVDPIVRYLNYEKAYQAGELDPAIEVLTTFECRHTTDSDAKEEDLAWLRDSMAIYR